MFRSQNLESVLKLISLFTIPHPVFILALGLPFSVTSSPDHDELGSHYRWCIYIFFLSLTIHRVSEVLNHTPPKGNTFINLSTDLFLSLMLQYLVKIPFSKLLGSVLFPSFFRVVIKFYLDTLRLLVTVWLPSFPMTCFNLRAEKFLCGVQFEESIRCVVGPCIHITA